MGRKIFISYKYADSTVKYIPDYYKHTARDYVDYIQDHNFSGDDINKGEEDGEDLSQFKDETIRDHLKTKIWDSSTTLVFISPNMVDHYKLESNQWIPWEITYSLRQQPRNGVISHPNAIIAVVLPDIYGNYDYFITEREYNDDGQSNNYECIFTQNTFKIISNNMFNQKHPDIRNFNGLNLYFGDCSYIQTVKWDDFINKTDWYLNKAIVIRDNIDDYNIIAQLGKDGLL